MVQLWLRREERPTECRAPLTPTDAAVLVDRGVAVTVEESASRVFEASEYASAGCEIAPGGSWPTAPADACVVGIKELPDEPADLRHTHIYFAHAFKGQRGAAPLLDRFRRGGGTLLDLEYLTESGRRVIAFGHWAGYVGAALGVLQATGSLTAPLTPMERSDLDARIAGASPRLRALVIGALGRSGRGAVAALELAGVTPTCWDLAETRRLDRRSLLAHDLLVNCVVSSSPGEPFVTDADVSASGRALTTIVDVTCDVTSPANRLPVNTSVTSWERPVRALAAPPTPLSVIAVDNLPSLLPREASVSFSAALRDLIWALPARQGPWHSAAEAFAEALRGCAGS